MKLYAHVTVLIQLRNILKATLNLKNADDAVVFFNLWLLLITTVLRNALQQLMKTITT